MRYYIFFGRYTQLAKCVLQLYLTKPYFNLCIYLLRLRLQPGCLRLHHRRRCDDAFLESDIRHAEILLCTTNTRLCQRQTLVGLIDLIGHLIDL